VRGGGVSEMGETVRQAVTGGEQEIEPGAAGAEAAAQIGGVVLERAVTSPLPGRQDPDRDGGDRGGEREREGGIGSESDCRGRRGWGHRSMVAAGDVMSEVRLGGAGWHAARCGRDATTPRRASAAQGDVTSSGEMSWIHSPSASRRRNSA